MQIIACKNPNQDSRTLLRCLNIIEAFENLPGDFQRKSSLEDLLVAFQFHFFDLHSRAKNTSPSPKRTGGSRDLLASLFRTHWKHWRISISNNSGKVGCSKELTPRFMVSLFCILLNIRKIQVCYACGQGMVGHDQLVAQHCELGKEGEKMLEQPNQRSDVNY
ncbi:hypothetical protein VNO77_23102 [Canavalia gladiata]|uniref:Uncharacterized protein n=1 Tax=Canavalia gladiata TaxID=3824 RepID=A0AAN9L3Z9_CANGL